MKKIYINIFIILIIFSFISFYIPKIYSQSPTKKDVGNSPTPSVGVVDKLRKIEQLKEKIATRVAQLRENEKGATQGTVKKIENNQITIIHNGQGEIINYSEDTLFYSLTKEGKTETSIKKVNEGQNIVIFGYFDEKKEILSAKYVYLTPDASFKIIGKIIDIDKSNYTITIKQPRELKVDIETSTKNYLISKDNTLVKGGFSKFKIGDIIHVQGVINSKDENTITATRILLGLPGLSPSLSATPSPSPTTVKKSPTPTNKTTPKPTIND